MRNVKRGRKGDTEVKAIEREGREVEEGKGGKKKWEKKRAKLKGEEAK